LKKEAKTFFPFATSIISRHRDAGSAPKDRRSGTSSGITRRIGLAANHDPQ
jgi:hypothetical protein